MLMLGTLTGLLILGLLVASKNNGLFLNSKISSSPIPINQTVYSPVPSATPVAITKQKVVPDLDPIVDCGPGQNSGQYIKDKQSNCKNYIDCGFLGNVWKLEPVDVCKKLQKQETDKINSYNQPIQKITLNCIIDGQNYVEYGSTTEQAQKYCDDLKAYGKTITPSVAPANTTNNGLPSVDVAAWNSKCRQTYQDNLMSTDAYLSANGISSSSAADAMHKQLTDQLNSCLK